ncbi:MAG TPA: hypothetical protein VM324_14530 [Egibacteraceae bacterium]|nr:hypothetical protein [Egibacteraceae bacterium]
MSLEHLLLWLSAKGQGSWSQFRGAVEELGVEQDYEQSNAGDGQDGPALASSDLPVYQRARFALQRLSHVEFFSTTAGHDWRVVPPAVAMLPSNPYGGLLCGARSPELMQRLDRCADLDVVAVDVPGMPQRIVLRGAAEALSAEWLGILVQADAATAILSAVPDVRDPATWFRMAIPETPGWAVHRFSSSRLGWVECTTTDAMRERTGLFRFVMKHQRFYYLRWHGCSYRVPVQVGKYAVMRKRRGLLAYDAATETLSVPAICRPPLLIERALVLCSGYLPDFDPRSGRLGYRSVPSEVARLAAQLLRQQVQ